MHIVYLIERIDKEGGVQRSLTTRVNYLVKNYSYKFTIVCTEKETGIPAYKIHESVNFIFLDKLTTKKTILGRIYLRYEQSKYIIKGLKPNILISTKYTLHNFFFHFIKKNTKLISEMREVKENYNLNRNTSVKSQFNAMIRDFIFKRQDIIITLTETDKKNWGFKNIKVVPNPKTIISKDVSTLNSMRVLALGRLDKNKAFDKLIDVWKLVNIKHPNWELKICGEGVEYQNLTKKIKHYKLHEKIILTNKFLPVIPELLEASIFTLTSQFESFGNVMVEAKTCGLPIIAFNAPNGPKEIIIDNEDGYLIKLNDVNKMAEKIIYLIENPEIRKKMGRRAKINSDIYNPEKIIKLYNKIICS